MKIFARLVHPATFAAMFFFFVGCGACGDEPQLLDPCTFGKVDECTCDDDRRGTRQCSDDGKYGDAAAQPRPNADREDAAGN